MKAIYTIYYEVNRKCFDRKIGDTVTKRRIFSTFEEALKYARRYTKTTKNINYVDTVIFENIYELTFEPTEVEAEIFTPVKKNKMYQLDTKGMDKDLRVEENEDEDKQYEVEEYVFAVATKKEAVKIAKEIANKRKKAIKIFKNGKQIIEIEPEQKEKLQIYKVLKGYSSKILRSFTTLQEAIDCAKKFAEMDKIPYTVILVSDKKEEQIETIEPPEEIAYYGIFGFDCKFNSIDEAREYAMKQYSKNDLKIYKAIMIDSGLRVKMIPVDVVSSIKKVSEKITKYVTDEELISMLVKEPVNANIYDFMREPEKIKISKKGKKKLMAVRDLVKRAIIAIPEKKKAIRTPKDVVDIMMKRLRYEAKENFYVLILNSKNKVINISKISQGSINCSVVHPANIFKEVLKYETSNSIVLVHNHPSGDPTPSIEDVKITGKIIEAGKLLDIEVIDHIIIGDGIYTSLKKEAIIKNNNVDMHIALQKCERS